jgi:hypothetical protein
MGPRDAALAMELLGVDAVAPIHWGTFPILAGTPEQFRAELDARRLGQVAVHGWAPVETLGGWARLSAGRAPEPMPAPSASMHHAGPWNGRPRSGNLYSARSDDPCYSLIASA